MSGNFELGSLRAYQISTDWFIRLELRHPGNFAFWGNGRKVDLFQAVTEAVDVALGIVGEWVIKKPKSFPSKRGFEARLILFSHRISPPKAYASGVDSDEARAIALAYINAINQLRGREERLKSLLGEYEKPVAASSIQTAAGG